MTKGFKPPRTVYRLDFEGTDLDGLEMRMRGGKLAQVFATVQLVGVTDDNMTASDVAIAMSQYQDLADHIIEWNYVNENDDPVAPDLEGLKSLEVRHVQMIAAAWQKAQVDIPAPLPHASSSSPATELSSIPMETLPASLAS